MYYRIWNMKVIIIKFVTLPKLRKEVGPVDSSFKKWGVAVHIRRKREWVSYDLKGSKVECPIRSNRETQGYLCGIHTKKMETRMCDIHTEIMETHRMFVWHSLKEQWGSFTQKKRQKSVAVHTK